MEFPPMKKFMIAALLNAAAAPVFAEPSCNPGVPPLQWSTNWDSIILFQEDQRWLEKEINRKRLC